MKIYEKSDSELRESHRIRIAKHVAAHKEVSKEGNLIHFCRWQSDQNQPKIQIAPILLGQLRVWQNWLCGGIPKRKGNKIVQFTDPP